MLDMNELDQVVENFVLNVKIIGLVQVIQLPVKYVPITKLSLAHHLMVQH